MTALIVIGCIILFFAFILSLKAKVTLEYAEELALSVRVLFVKVRILPKKEKKPGPHSMSERKAKKIKKQLEKKAEKKRRKALEKAEKKKAKRAAAEGKPKKKRSLEEILDLIAMIKDILTTVLGKFFSHLRIDLARLHVTVGAEDAASAALYYGIICDALLHLLPVLESLKGFDTPDARDLSVDVDYLSESITADVKISMSLRVWHVFHVAFAALGRLISHLVRQKLKKGS